MTNFIISNYPHPMPTTSTKNNADGAAEVPRALAGRARWLYEMASGESGEAGENPQIPKNPQGLYGIDHSGAPYGVALRHPVFIGDPTSGTASSFWVGAASHYTFNDEQTRSFRIWVKPHVDGAGPYSRATIMFFAQAGSGTPDLLITARNSTRGDVATLTQGLTTTKTLYESGLDLDLASGWNDLEITFAPVAGATMAVWGWSFSQTVQIRDS